MILGPKSQSIYKNLLASGKPMEAKELAGKLGIFPTTVYRLAEPLLQMGLIAQVGKYPVKFKAKPSAEGLSLFLLHQNDWFSQLFTNANKPKIEGKPGQIPQSQQVSISFVQSRDELMRLSEGEINKTLKSVDLLRSGHEIPAEVMLAIIEAQKRGVQTRMLIQDYSEENAQQVAIWQRNGILVKKTPLRHIRLMLYDSSIVYFMSYKHTDSEKDLGMKIDYPPFAVILSQLFDAWWKKAEAI